MGSSPHNSLSGLSSVTYFVSNLFFVFSDAHINRNRPLAIALGFVLVAVTVSNVVYDVNCPVQATLFSLASANLSLSKCDIRRSIYLGILITMFDGVITSLSDRANERLWFVLLHADRATGDAAESAGAKKRSFLQRRVASTLNIIERRIA